MKSVEREMSLITNHSTIKLDHPGNSPCQKSTVLYCSNRSVKVVSGLQVSHEQGTVGGTSMFAPGWTRSGKVRPVGSARRRRHGNPGINVSHGTRAQISNFDSCQQGYGWTIALV